MALQIMVPLDGSPFSEEALPAAIELARSCNATLHLTRVLDQGARARQDHEPDDRELAARAVEIRVTSGLTVYSTVLSGHIASALKSYVASSNIALVVMTTHGRRPLGQWWLGSVASELVRRLPVPLLLIRPRRAHRDEPVRALNHILVPLDGSELSEVILEPVVPIARITGARLTLVRVISPKARALHSAGGEAQVAHQACAYLERLAAGIARAGFRVDTMTIPAASPAKGILEAARSCSANLVAMATHARSGWDRVIEGSVEEEVVRGTRIPLLVTGPASTAAAEIRTRIQGPA
jgi:nucleotide-binding universal stress UspA family protein